MGRRSSYFRVIPIRSHPSACPTMKAILSVLQGTAQFAYGTSTPISQWEIHSYTTTNSVISPYLLMENISLPLEWMPIYMYGTWMWCWEVVSLACVSILPVVGASLRGFGSRSESAWPQCRNRRSVKGKLFCFCFAFIPYSLLYQRHTAPSKDVREQVMKYLTLRTLITYLLEDQPSDKICQCYFFPELLLAGHCYREMISGAVMLTARPVVQFHPRAHHLPFVGAICSISCVSAINQLPLSQ